MNQIPLSYIGGETLSRYPSHKSICITRKTPVHYLCDTLKFSLQFYKKGSHLVDFSG